MINPVSTYRVQLHKGFGFAQLQNILGYLHQLGIGTLYASPVFNAVPGSNHGYDGLNPLQINPEIGTEEQLRQISLQLKNNSICWLQDIVPNHMAFHPGNEWLMEVLAKGKESKYAAFFDINWDTPLMVPFLGSELQDVITKKELTLAQENGRRYVRYYDSSFPLRDDVHYAAFDDAHIKEILDQQHYRLCSWQETDHTINYRRFFTINGLICVNIQHDNVFETYHGLISQLLQDGVFDGLRVDHIDGLYDPTKYLQQLQELPKESCYITVEKILQQHEQLPAWWTAHGNTGYDFLAMVNNLMTNSAAAGAFTDYYQQLTNDFRPLSLQVQEKKAYILFNHMQGELQNLYDLFRASDLVDKKSFARSRGEDLREALAELLVRCPVYRYYSNSMPLREEEAAGLRQLLNEIRAQNGELRQAVDLLQQALLDNPHQGDESRNARAAHFFQRCMQFTGPLMAKGVEDTLMYTYNRFIAHNEVGDHPDRFGMDVPAFHHAMAARAVQWAYSLNATATHDTKRGEDVRARLNVLSDIPDEWIQQVEEWRQANEGIRGNIDANDEYFIYQSICGAYPFPGEEVTAFEARMTEYLRKALREAKTNSNWTTPNEEYESSINGFVHELLQPGTPFFQSFEKFQQRIVDHGIINSLSQLLLKCTCPGVPDIYQGCEGWDLSFVDPDNRRPVDYTLRKQWLQDFDNGGKNDFRSLWQERYSGKIKCWLTQQLLAFRKEQPELLAQGEYIPLEVQGSRKDHVIAFARKFRRHIYIVAVPLHTAMLHEDPLQIDWEDTRIMLPQDADASFDDIFTGTIEAYKGEVHLREAFSEKPFLIWKGKQKNRERSAGLLLHISSLPSPFGIGDMGPEANRFADFLYQSKQKYWQLLPLNPTTGGQGYSPYSALSAMAGNPLFISPEVLVKEGLLTAKELASYYLDNNGRVDYQQVESRKEELLNKAFWSFLKHDNRSAFDLFCEKESYWLHDFARFMVLKTDQQGKPWYEWPAEFKLRDDASLQQFDQERSDDLYRVKWLQFVFCRQWSALKSYCNERNIQLIGDLPIYVSYDSADAWSQSKYFAIDADGHVTGVAGVPPDAFSADGQLWGMPVFRWEVMQADGFEWWLKRVRRNRELFDIIRIDHFRAFESYWEVPAGSSTAKHGSWQPGPGAAFFEAVQQDLGELPFIAEDLGDVDDAVFNLRDAFQLPGMKVLQFAFGNDMPHSVHIPHNHGKNFIVYTGTHDNNTTRGWFKSADDQTKSMLNQYAGRNVTEDDVHWILARLAYGSVARIAILPIQDILNLDESGRMNIPASAQSNWAWRLVPGQLNKDVEQKLKELVAMYNR